MFREISFIDEGVQYDKQKLAVEILVLTHGCDSVVTYSEPYAKPVYDRNDSRLVDYEFIQRSFVAYQCHGSIC